MYHTLYVGRHTINPHQRLIFLTLKKDIVSFVADVADVADVAVVAFVNDVPSPFYQEVHVPLLCNNVDCSTSDRVDIERIG
ncbi:MAG: hypothetical protein ACXVBU_02815 [Ktedonobacteraceae bacterium]